jgi:hypothetical protein
MKKLFMTMFVSFPLAGSPAMAAVACQGVVTQTYMEPNGDTYVTWGTWNTRICNPGQSVNVDRGPNAGGGTTISPAACQSLTAMFMTAKSQGKQVQVFIDKTSCSFGGGYENPYPYYFFFLP